MVNARWWFLETKGLNEIQIEKGGVYLVSYIGGKSVLFDTQQDFMNALDSMLEYSKRFEKVEPKNTVVHNYQITIKIMEDQSSKIIVEPLPKDPPKEENKNVELDKRIIHHYQIKDSKFFLCGRGALDGWGPEDQCAVHVEHVNCKECLKEWIKRKQQEI